MNKRDRADFKVTPLKGGDFEVKPLPPGKCIRGGPGVPAKEWAVTLDGKEHIFTNEAQALAFSEMSGEPVSVRIGAKQ